MQKIGVISDTHDFLDPRIARLFAGVEHILHAGDIGSPKLLGELQTVAPVTAVGGNTDDPALKYQSMQVVTLGGRKFLLHHIVNPNDLTSQLQNWIAREQPNVVVFGHTHKPFAATRDGILFFNPGYAGKSRFGMQRTVALLHLEAESIRHEFLQL